MKRLVSLVGSGRCLAAGQAGMAVFILVVLLSVVLQPVLAGGSMPDDSAAWVTLWPAFGIGMVYIGYGGGLLGALRLPRVGGEFKQQLWYELTSAAIVVLAIASGALLAHMLAGVWLDTSGPDVNQNHFLWSPLLALASVAAAGMAYPLGRCAVLVWPVWDRLRRTRLLWALTHAQLVGSLILAACVALVVTAVTGGQRFASSFEPEILDRDAKGVTVLLIWLTSRILPVLSDMMIVGFAVSGILLPVAVLISSLVLRSTTLRVEELAAATAALRAGDLAARVSVAGEDEVSRLQADFNAMAIDLQRTLHELHGERDRVAALLDSRRQLVASVSHELRTPVATVRGYLEAAVRHNGTSGGEHLLDLEAMEREVRRLQRLIDDLFALSRIEVGQLDLRLAPTDVGIVVRGQVDTMAPLAWQQGRVQVLAEVATVLPLAWADAERLKQIVSNLVGNSVRHTGPGGLVAVTINTEASVVRIDVRDTGVGIASDDLPRIFERFYRGASDGDERREGTGLGLALVKELAEAMGGSVEVSSELGEGSCFTVRLSRA